jgi:hypothetical protein
MFIFGSMISSIWSLLLVTDALAATDSHSAFGLKKDSAL